jgi:hypothetical protein
VKIRLLCPSCETPGSLVVGETPTTWHCPGCEHTVVVPGPTDLSLPACLVCGCGDLYKQKDFPQRLGVSILTAAVVASTITCYLYQKWWTWGILLGSAVVDGGLYLWVPDSVVCYRCSAHYRGVADNPEHRPFELTTFERYRQEKLRREQLAREGKT